jgi:hypothetical protein
MNHLAKYSIIVMCYSFHIKRLNGALYHEEVGLSVGAATSILTSEVRGRFIRCPLYQRTRDANERSA